MKRSVGPSTFNVYLGLVEKYSTRPVYRECVATTIDLPHPTSSVVTCIGQPTPLHFIQRLHDKIKSAQHKVTIH